MKEKEQSPRAKDGSITIDFRYVSNEYEPTKGVGPLGKPPTVRFVTPVFVFETKIDEHGGTFLTRHELEELKHFLEISGICEIKVASLWLELKRERGIARLIQRDQSGAAYLSGADILTFWEAVEREKLKANHRDPSTLVTKP